MNKSHHISKIILLSCILVLNTNAIDAAVTYEYSGNNFTNATSPYDTSMSVSGSFTVDSLLVNVSGEVSVNSFSFSDGVHTLTSQDIVDVLFQFDTDGFGNILNWEIKIDTPPPESLGQTRSGIRTRGIPNILGFETFDAGYIAQCTSAAFGECRSIETIASGVFNEFDNPGSWSIVPIPPALWLFGSGLLGLVGISRRKKSA